MKLMKWRKWILGAALAVACVECVVLWQRSQGEHSKPAEYKRYVSRPLPGGTRYTLLYPARVSTQTLVRHGSGGWFMAFKANPQNGGCNDISVLSSPQSNSFEAARQTNNSLSHSVRFHEADWKGTFFIEHNNCAEDVELFEREDRVVIDSFQILPPGAPVPSP